VTPNRTRGHLQRSADFLDIHVFAIPKNQDRPWSFRQRGDQPSQAFLQQRIRFGNIRRDIRQRIDLHFPLKTGPPHRIDTTVHSASTQPGNAMGARLNRTVVLEELQKDVLRQLFRDRVIVEKVTGNAVDHSLVLANNGFELILRHLPSDLITDGGQILTQKLAAGKFPNSDCVGIFGSLIFAGPQ
jgi:hypothetical protein